MRYIELRDGTKYGVPETAEEEFAMSPEGQLRAMFSGDVAATIRYHDRRLDLDRRFHAWAIKQFGQWAEGVEADLRRLA